jgi:spermidine/putrescine transport system ATP-binding protein
MQIELKRIQSEVGTTFVHVTHDQEEAMTMADTVAVMNAGRIEQMGHPADVYELPRTIFVANFLGQSNLIQGMRVSSSDMVEVSANGLGVKIPSQRNVAPGQSIVIGVRPEKITVLDAHDESKLPIGHNRIYGTVTDVSYTGVSTQYLVETPWGQSIIAFEQNSIVGDRCELGDPVVLGWAPEHTFGLDPAEGLNAGLDHAVLELESDTEA